MSKTVKIRIKIKYFNGDAERDKALKTAKKLGLKVFSALSMDRNEGRPPEGWHVLDLGHVFSNQYNTDKFRVFEFHDPLVAPYGRCVPLNVGYYISEGIEAIRAYQKDLKVCGHCEAQYYKSAETVCKKCVGSEYLEEKYYPLLNLRNICDEKSPDKPLPPDMLALIQSEQKKTRQRKLEKQRADKLQCLQNDIASAETEYDAFKWLIDADMDFENVIFYSHTRKFCFGWRNAIGVIDAEKLHEKLKDFPYAYEVKTV